MREQGVMMGVFNGWRRGLLWVLLTAVMVGCTPLETADLGTPWPTLAARETVTAAPTLTPTPGTEATPLIPATPTLPPGIIAEHVVSEGETIITIADLYAVPAEVILQFNAVPGPEAVYVGLVLQIPSQAALDSLAITPVPTPILVEADNPLYEYSIPYLNSRTYEGGTLERVYTAQSTEAYGQQLMQHTTDEGIVVTALVNIPVGEGPFPVIILLHGGIDQSVYRPGDGTRNHADFLARSGYLTIAPDYRSYNGSGGTGTPLKIPWSIDVLNLIAALDTLPQADPTRIGVMGHSRGGGVGSYLAVLPDATPGVRAIAFYNSLHFDQAVVWNHYRQEFGATWPDFDARRVGTPAENPTGYAATSPINYLDQVAVPIQIHHGALDTITPPEWSRELAAELESLGKTVEYHEYPNAEHTFWDEDYELFLERLLAFFDAYVR